MEQRLRLARVGDHAIPVPITVDVTSDDENGPHARVIVDVVDGKLEVRVVEIEAQPGQRGVRQGDLAAVKVADVVEEAMTRWAAPVVAGPGSGERTMTMTLGPGQRSAAKRALRAAATIDLERVAAVYLAAETQPTMAVKESFGVSHRTASLYAQRAREAGLLPPTKHGRKKA